MSLSLSSEFKSVNRKLKVRAFCDVQRGLMFYYYTFLLFYLILCKKKKEKKMKKALMMKLKGKKTDCGML